MKNFFFSIDFEEWFHIPYLEKYNFKKDDFPMYSSQMLSFFEYLSKKGIKATVFCVGDIAEQNKEIIKKISMLGHEIGCHSAHHKCVNLQSDEEFEKETLESKIILERIIGKKVVGYRAPSFSMTIEKLNILKKLGFIYDASMIRSTANEYYNVMNINEFEKIDSLVYKYNDILEFETPTFNFLGKRMPFAGGGFFRLIPFCIYKIIAKSFLNKNNNIMFFAHPYEVIGTKFPGSKVINMKDKFRINVRRKSMCKRIKKVIKLFNNTNFITYSEYTLKKVVKH